MQAVALVALLAAAPACSKPAGPATLTDSAPQVAADGDAAQRPAVGPVQPQLAYSYAASVSAPAGAVSRLLARHEAACLRAGAAVCQVIGAKRADEGAEATAELALRAQPAWLQAFRSDLDADVRPFGGKIVSTSTTTEDLTRAIVDTDAALRAKTTLADRLQQLLTTRQGKVAELLETEKALAQTQGEIDAARSELAVMRARVATSDLTLSYTSRQVFGGPWRPVAEAVHGAVGAFAQGTAAMILIIALLLPFGAVAAAIAVAWRWVRGRAKRPPQSV